MSTPSLHSRVLLLGLAGTRWLFGVALVSAMLAWAGEASMGVLDPLDRIGYPALCAGLLLLQVLLAWRPDQLRWWQRGGTTLVAAYFALLLFGLMLRDDPGPTVYTLSTVAPWLLGGLLLLFTTWGPRQALALSLTMVALLFLPAVVRRFGDQPPHWLLEAAPFLLNIGMAATMYCFALWGVSRQLSHFLALVPAQSAQITAGELAQARVEELERSREQIEAASRAKSEFLAALGHEIRTPMNTVLGMIQLVLAESPAHEQAERLRQAQRAGESLLHMIDSLLDFATLDAGRLHLQPGPLRIEQVLESAINSVRTAAQSKQIELLCEFSSLELLGDAGWRRGDAVRITQVLSELLTNAVKFTAKGQVRLRAALRTGKQEGEDWLVLQVRDSGIGIPDEQLPRLFTPFAQAEGGKARRFGGTGLGLAIAQRLTRLMQGSLTVRSAPGRGSEFELRLPLPRCAASSADRSPPGQQVVLVQAPHTPGHQGLQVLIQHLAPRATLQVLGTGEAALTLLAQSPEPLDLLLVDWVLPDMDGLQLLERQAARGGGLAARRIVLLSSFDTPALRERALKLGAQLLCAKPVMPPTLRLLLDPKARLPVMAPATPSSGPASTNRAALVTEFDQLLGSADSRAVTLWASHESELMEILPAQHVKALAGAMQRLDFDAAQAALRHAQPHPDTQEPP